MLRLAQENKGSPLVAKYRLIFHWGRPLIEALKARWTLIGLIVMTLSSTAASATSQIALKTRAVIDVRRGVSVHGAVILIENGHISAVGTNVTVPTGVKTIDLSRLTVIPGLIDTHTHLLSDC